MSNTISEHIEKLEQRIKTLESAMNESGYTTDRIVTSKLKKSFHIMPQADTHFGLLTALCVDTNDPWKQNRVRFFTPLFHNPNIPVDALDFANSVSSLGGFDDSGASWVPPAGSTLCILFENGDRAAAFYVGTTWHRNRGPDGQHNWGYPIKEYDDIHEGHRKGYLVGSNDGSQVLPPWNTESYNGIDLNSVADFDNVTNAQQNTTYPNIYGFKTPQKHMVKMVDGDYKCHHKNKRLEILSSCGNWLIFKDDHLHQFKPTDDSQGCNDDEGNCGSTGGTTISGSKYFKNRNETRPWKGPGTPQNNNCVLNQSGIQFLSISGHSLFMDDSVEEPSGIPEWEKSTKSFDFGCTNKFTGKVGLVSATGHRIELDDNESDTEVRSDSNAIRLRTACGHLIEMNDHSKDKNLSGNRRGISIVSTSRHTLELYDGEDLEQGSPRQEGGEPDNSAKNAYVSLRSGYGLQILLEDTNNQQNTEHQRMLLLAPQKDNKVAGPHMVLLQESIDPQSSQLFVRAGGIYYCYSFADHFTAVGDKKNNPSDKITVVSRNNLLATEEFYVNEAQIHLFDAKELIVLGAGRDCWIDDKDHSKGKGPCLMPVLAMNPFGFIVASDRVFVSASQDAPCMSIFQLTPFHDC